MQHSLSLAAVASLLTSSLQGQEAMVAPDDTFIDVSGTVTEVNPQSFKLDVGGDTITVEMDDWDADADAYKLVDGDQVTVNGIVDDDLFERRTIEARSVYVEDLNTYFYASAADEEDAYVAISQPVVATETVIQGTVSSVGDDEFMINTVGGTIEVEVDEMPYNPLDEEGFQQITAGDRVSVTGDMDYDFLEGHVVDADSIVTLAQNETEEE